MHIPPAPNIFSYPSFTSHPASEYGYCFLCTPTSHTILLSQALGVVALAFLLFAVVEPISRRHKAFYKVGQGVAASWFAIMISLMVHSTWTYFTDPWATPWAQEKPDNVRQSGVRLLVVGFNIAFQVVILGGYGATVWFWTRAKQWRGRKTRGGGTDRRLKEGRRRGEVRALG